MNRYPGGTAHENGGHNNSSTDNEEEDEDDEPLSRDDDPRGPLSPRQRQQEDTQNRHRQSQQRGVTAQPPQPQPQEEEEEEDTDETEEQQHDRIIARILAERWAALASGVDDDENDSVDSSPRDPLERLNQMEEEDEKRKSIAQIRLEPRKGGALSGMHTNDRDKKRAKSNDDELEYDEKDLVRRIVELRIAAIEAGEQDDDDSTTSGPPQDPLVRIMNMNAEDTLIAAVSLMQYVAQPEESDEEDDDAVVRNRDIFDLNNMILNNNLEDLEKKAVFLAQSVKHKLDQIDTPAYKSWKTTTTSSSDTTGIGYLALAKDAVNRSMETAKVDADDGNERRARWNNLNEATILSPKSRKTYIQQIPPNSKTSPSIRISATASERGWDEKVGNESFNSPVSPMKKRISSHVEVPVSDWWGVVSDIATFGAGSDTWESDSQSNLSYGSTDSAVTDSSADENMQRLPNGGAIDWEGINAAIQRQKNEMSAILPSTGEGHVESSLEEKRRKKRELEALKISISTSVAQRDTDAWRLSLTKSGL